MPGCSLDSCNAIFLFKKKQNIKSGRIIKSAFLCLAMLVCIGFLCFFDEWKSFVELFSTDWLGKVLSLTLNRYARLFAGVIILVITCFDFY